MPIDAYILLFSIIVGMHIGYIHLKSGRDDNPIWPVRIYMDILNELTMSFEDYADSQQRLTYRQQYLVTSIVWIAIVFLGLIVLFEVWKLF